MSVERRIAQSVRTRKETEKGGSKENEEKGGSKQNKEEGGGKENKEKGGVAGEPGFPA